MSLYAIKQLSTGYYLPQPRNSRGTILAKGYTHVEPSPTEPPRLFNRYSSAQSSLNYWLKGKMGYEYVAYDHSTWPDKSRELTIRPMPTRVPTDFKVVHVVIVDTSNWGIYEEWSHEPSSYSQRNTAR
jgi:hypothetical protein